MKVGIHGNPSAPVLVGRTKSSKTKTEMLVLKRILLTGMIFMLQMKELILQSLPAHNVFSMNILYRSYVSKTNFSIVSDHSKIKSLLFNLSHARSKFQF